MVQWLDCSYLIQSSSTLSLVQRLDDGDEEGEGEEEEDDEDPWSALAAPSRTPMGCLPQIVFLVSLRYVEKAAWACSADFLGDEMLVAVAVAVAIAVDPGDADDDDGGGTMEICFIPS